ncbi:MAG TPA: hypothetical protein VK657_07510, partial [Terriglobales bacterium]|nr:hypothetical protein [Terriglobales bacterium]
QAAIFGRWLGVMNQELGISTHQQKGKRSPAPMGPKAVIERTRESVNFANADSIRGSERGRRFGLGPRE